MKTSPLIPSEVEGRAAGPEGYRWLLDAQGTRVAVAMNARALLVLLGTDALFAVLMALPPVVRATGIGPATSTALVAAHFLWCVLAGLIHEKAPPRPWVFTLLTFGNAAAALIIASTLIVLGGDPKTPLWAFLVLYAAINGALPDTRPSRVLLGAHLLAPLATIPFFAADSGPWRMAGPLVCGLSSAATYHYIAGRVSVWRGMQRERDRALSRLREREQEVQRLHLARDLHDSVGSALGLLSLQAQLLERHADDPQQVRRLAALGRDAAKGGLGDLYGVLEALTPPEETAGALGQALRDLAARALGGLDVRAEVRTASGKDVPLAPTVRLTLVRAFQEALRNAVTHGGARSVRTTLDASAAEVVLEVTDDGAGFDVATRAEGRGLLGMRTRAQELGGSVSVVARPGSGVRVRLSLPARAA